MTPEANSLSVSTLKELDPDSSVSRYRQIADQLAAAILDQRPGVRLPSETEIVAHLKVSRATATQALRDLEQRGLVTRRQGRGTFVAEADPAIRSNKPGRLPSFSEDLRAAGHATRERVIALEIVAAPAEVAAALSVPVGSDVWAVERLIVADDEPVVHLTSWLPCPLVPALTRSGIEETSLYEFLAAGPSAPGRPSAADERWSAAHPPAATASLLQVARSAPVMRVIRTAYRDQQPLEYAISYVRGESFAVSIRTDAANLTGGAVALVNESGR